MTKYDFLLRSFASYNQQIQVMLETQREVFDALCQIKPEDTPDNTYSDIVSDGGLDPRTKYEAERFKRQWVGLTDEEIDHLDEANWDDDHEVWGPKEFARAVEAKLKEKNGW